MNRLTAPAEAVKAALSAADWTFLEGLQQDALGQGRLALVGGAVRDALLGVPTSSPDLDIVLDTGAGGLGVGELARRYSARTGLPHTYHPQFDNASLALPGGRSADLIRARRESYPQPGARPAVTPGTLEDDLQRRDFGLNALALTLDAAPQLLDVTGGLADLQGRVLRPLHPQSFREDASRLVRGARLAGRLGLQAHAELLRQVPDALELAPHTKRLWAELRQLLAEPQPAAAVRALNRWGAGALLPAGTLPLFEALEAAGAASTPAVPDLYAAALLQASGDAACWQGRLGLGGGPARLLDRALSPDCYPVGTAEQLLRRALQPQRPDYLPLQGRDLLAAGWAAGPQLGQALAFLQQLRAAGQVSSRAEEWAALRDAASFSLAQTPAPAPSAARRQSPRQ